MSFEIYEAFLADKSYKLGDANKGQTITGPNGNRWMVVDTRDTATGYQGALLKNVDTGKYELVSRGTEFDREPIKDGVADLQMRSGQLSEQYGLSTTGSTMLLIAAVNDAPVTQGETAQTQEDTAIYFNVADLLRNDSDVDTATDGQVLGITGIALSLIHISEPTRPY